MQELGLQMQCLYPLSSHQARSCILPLSHLTSLSLDLWGPSDNSFLAAAAEHHEGGEMAAAAQQQGAVYRYNLEDVVGPRSKNLVQLRSNVIDIDLERATRLAQWCPKLETLEICGCIDLAFEQVLQHPTAQQQHHHHRHHQHQLPVAGLSGASQMISVLNNLAGTDQQQSQVRTHPPLALLTSLTSLSFEGGDSSTQAQMTLAQLAPNLCRLVWGLGSGGSETYTLGLLSQVPVTLRRAEVTLETPGMAAALHKLLPVSELVLRLQPSGTVVRHMR